MPLKAVVGGAEKLAAKADVYINGAKKRVVRIDAWNGSAWKLAKSFAPSLTVSVTPEVFGGSSAPAGGAISSEPATALPSGGQGPFAYVWTRLSGTTMTLSAPASATTTFTAPVPAGVTRTAVYQVTVTDNLGQTASSTVNITLSNFA